MKNNSERKNILLIITGSVAAYKSVDLIRKLQKKDYNVKVILTKSAQKFITKMLVASIAGKENIYEDIFEEKDPMSHISLSREVDLLIVAPATANFLAKVVNGNCDDLASATVAASNKKTMIVPAMNKEMWNNQANLLNIKKIVNYSKIELINPIEDVLACREVGIGKMESCQNIVTKVEEFFKLQNCLKSYHFIITGGGTREEIDTVRFIGNASSGRQAIEIAHFAHFCGAEVSFIAANIELPINIEKDHLYRVKSCDEMHETVSNIISSSDHERTIFISCAAVADFKPKEKYKTKIKKGPEDEISIDLVKNIDILHQISNLKTNRPRVVVGFAAEDGENLINNAKNKLATKNCDLIVANDIESGKIFNSQHSSAYLIDNKDLKKLGTITKSDIARKLIQKIMELL